jgi:hypothetical protein
VSFPLMFRAVYLLPSTSVCAPVTVSFIPIGCHAEWRQRR